MLELRPGCEHCDRDLPPNSSEAWICSFECTWCTACANALDHVCPNCQGRLEPRPGRPANLLEAFPPSTERVHKPVPALSGAQTIRE
jgi:hypothetical protein